MAEQSLKHKTKKGIYWTSFNQFATNGLTFVVGIIMARILSPTDYGIAAIPSIFTVIANVFIDAGFTSAMVRKPELSEQDLSTAFFYSSTVGLLCYVLLFIASPWIADFYNTPVLTPLIRVTSLSFLWGPLITPQRILLNRELDFKTPTYIAIITNIISAIIGISLAYLGYGLWSLVVMGVSTSFLTFILTWIAVKWYPKAKWSNESFKYLWGFGNKLMAASMLDTIYGCLAPIIIGKYYSPQDLGVYNRADSYASLPTRQGTHILGGVAFPVLSKIQDDDAMLANSYRKMLKLAAFVIFPIMVMLAALARPLIILLVTEKWEACIILLQILCFAQMLYPIHTINLNLLQVKGRTDLSLKLEVWKKIISISVMLCTLPLGLIYFASSLILISILQLIINTYYTGKLINVGFWTQVRDIFPTLGLSFLVFVIIIGLNHVVDNLWLQLILGGGIGITLYLGIAYLLHFSELQDVRYMLSKTI